MQDSTLRYRYASKERQDGTVTPNLVNFGARMYDPLTGSWLTPDPLAHKYTSWSPYAYCAGNPVNFVDPDGRFVGVLVDATSVALGVKNLIENIRLGNTRAAIGDAVGVVIDVVAAALPVIPGGVGFVRTGTKSVDVVDAINDATKSKTYVTYTKTNPITKEVYSGRASGYGTPEEIVAQRDKWHHMNSKGYDSAVLDKSSKNFNAIRGQEQYLIEKHGGAKSWGGTSGNMINGISPKNQNKGNDQVTRKGHKNGKLIPIYSSMSPEDVSKSIFEHNNLF